MKWLDGGAYGLAVGAMLQAAVMSAVDEIYDQADGQPDDRAAPS